MPDQIKVEVVGGEAAVAREDVESRQRFLERAVLVGGAVLAGGVLVAGIPRLAVSQPSEDQDAKILNFALVLEELQAAFYEEALDRARPSGEWRQFVTTVGEHERRHLAFLRETLGSAAAKAPKFDFGDTTSDEAKFRETVVALEDIGLAAYNGQATNLTPGALGAAAKIVSVEARHASWARDLAGQAPAPRASDSAISEDNARDELRDRGLLG
ncbi:MAG: ferritin-like domain-containing protein [Thermoleophilaceae bacterium]|nr:ferritin-like domain-containing protein [Thermoleophilaceae bacterium]